MLRVSISAAIRGVLTKAPTHGSGVEQPFSVNGSFELVDGAGAVAGTADKLYVARRTIAGSGLVDIDLAGALTTDMGDVVTFARVKAVILKHVSGANNVIVGNSVAPWFPWFNNATDELILRPTMTILMAINNAAGWTVTATTADVLRLTNSAAGNVDVDVAVVGSAT
jgi:hypothetical protein